MVDITKSNPQKSMLLAAITVVFAVIARFLTLHLPNVAPFEAMMIFGVFAFHRKSLSLILPLAAWFITDLIINNTLYSGFYEGFTWISQSFVFAMIAMLLIFGFTQFLKKRSEEKGHVLGHYTLASVVSPLLFFVVSNFGVWAGMNMYPPTLSGLSMCYVSALPFLTYGMASTIGFSIIFGVMGYLFQRQSAQSPSQA